MDLDSAIKAHGEWKLKFRQAIMTQSQLDAPSIGADNCCELGKWLHGEAKNKYGRLKSYAACVTKHAEFHREAGKVAKLINAGQYDEADKLLGGGSSYTAASSSVGGAVLGLRKEAVL